MEGFARSEPEMLAGLIGQAEDEGASRVTLRALVEEASELGAMRALERIGLGDAKAGSDILELRELLGAWRTAKGSLWKALVSGVARWALAFVLAALAVKLGLGERLGA